MNPYDKAHELARAIRGSETFVNLKAARAKIEQDPSTLTMLQDFRKLQWEMQTKQLTGQAISDDEQEKLRQLAEVMQLHDDVSQYLESEYQLTMILSDLQRILGETVEDAMLPLPISEQLEDEKA